MGDDDATEVTAGIPTGSANPVRSKKGVARVGLKAVDEQAQKIWNAARRTEVAEVAIARAVTGKADASASGGRWISRIAMLRLYGVVEKTRDGYFKLSDLGIALANVGNASEHLKALGTAVMGIPANATLLRRYDGGELPNLDTLATEFEFGFSMSNADAKAAAQVLIDSAKYAALVDASGHVNLSGAVVVEAAVDADADANTDSDAEENEDASEEDDFDDGVADEGEDNDPNSQIGLLTPGGIRGLARTPKSQREALDSGSPSVALHVKLDMSAWKVDDVLLVLAALGHEDPSREPRT